MDYIIFALFYWLLITWLETFLYYTLYLPSSFSNSKLHFSSPSSYLMECTDVSLDTEVQMSMGVSHDMESVSELLTNLRLSDLYNLPGESVAMTPEIFSSMRAGDKTFLEKIKNHKTPMACFKNNKGDSILHVAASFGHPELVESIISECPSLLLEPNWKDRIPIHVAARAGHLAVVKVLAASIAYFSAKLSDEERERLNLYVVKDIHGNTPLHLSLKYLQEKTERLMKQRIRMEGFLFHVCFYLDCTSKHKYFSKESESLMETALYLVSVNQRVSFLANKEETSPLYLAVQVGNFSLVNAMLSPSVNSVQIESSILGSQLEGKKSLVHAALRAKKTDVLDIILKEYPSLVNERNEEGQTCISVGASVGFYEGVCKLLDLSTSSVFESNEDGSFPIHKAVEKGHEDVVEELLKRCPASLELVNKEDQNVLHIAAKSGKAVNFLKRHIKKHSKTKHLFEEQDVDGNTPLHLATINWHPQAVDDLTRFLSKQVLDIQNKAGLKPLDIAQKNLQPEYIFRERMTLMVLLCVYKPRGISWIPTSGMTLKSKLDKKVGDEKFEDRINILLLMAALVATITFAAGFTMPGGFSSSAPNMGMAILADDIDLSYFLVCDTLAMQCSLVAIVALVWAQLGDQELAHKAFHLALPSLFIALLCMSFAFMYGVLATIKENKPLTMKITVIFVVLTFGMIFLLAPYVIPQLHGIPLLEIFSRMYLDYLLMLVNEEDDAGKLYTSDPDHSEPGFLKRSLVLIKKRLPSRCSK